MVYSLQYHSSFVSLFPSSLSLSISLSLSLFEVAAEEAVDLFGNSNIEAAAKYLEMSKSKSRRVSFSSDQASRPTVTRTNKRRVTAVFWVFQLPKSTRFSPENFLRRLGAKVAKVLRYVSFRKRPPSSSVLKNNDSSASNFNRSHSVSDSMETHRAEAVKDCIQFFNSSSSL